MSSSLASNQTTIYRRLNIPFSNMKPCTSARGHCISYYQPSTTVDLTFITLHSYFLQFPCTGVDNSFRPFFNNNKYRNRGILRNIQFPSGIKTKFGPTFYVLYICGVIIPHFILHRCMDMNYQSLLN